MKNHQQQEARELYLSTDMTKTEIADAIGVHRTTIHMWVSQGEWSRMKYCARHLPSLISEKCYFILGDLADSLLDRKKHADSKDADTIYKLISGITKLKARTTSNEGMEMFTHFMEKLSGKDPQLARTLRPHITEYMTARKSLRYADLPRQDESPLKELPMTEKNIIEQRLDEADYDKWAQERYDDPAVLQEIADQQKAMKEFLDAWHPEDHPPHPPKENNPSSTQTHPVEQCHSEPVQQCHNEPVQQCHGEPVQQCHGEPVEPTTATTPENKTLHPSTDYQALAS